MPGDGGLGVAVQFRVPGASRPGSTLQDSCTEQSASTCHVNGLRHGILFKQMVVLIKIENLYYKTVTIQLEKCNIRNTGPR